LALQHLVGLGLLQKLSPSIPFLVLEWSGWLFLQLKLFLRCRVLTLRPTPAILDDRCFMFWLSPLAGLSQFWSVRNSLLRRCIVSYSYPGVVTRKSIHRTV
jgi:hypothetical protein